MKQTLPALQTMNSQLWERVHTLEFKVLEELRNKKRDQKLFAKNLVRVAKYLDSQGVSVDEIKEMLSNPKERRPDSSESSGADESLEEQKQHAPKPGNETDSASDFDDLEKPETVSLPNISGLVPESLLVNVNYKKFAAANGFEDIDQNANVL